MEKHSTLNNLPQPVSSHDEERAAPIDGEIVEDMLRKLKGYKKDINKEELGNARIILNHATAFTTDKRMLSYMLATAMAECSLWLIPEKRLPPDHKRRYLQDAYWDTGYYGRGYVQLTHKENYRKLGKEVNRDLVNNPDEALEPELAGRIMALAMVKGLLTTHKLSDYFNEDKEDWEGARKIVNGTNRKEEIATCARGIFEQ